MGRSEASLNNAKLIPSACRPHCPLLDWSVGAFFLHVDRAIYLVPKLIPAKCELRDVIQTSGLNRGEFVFLTANSTLSFDKAHLVVLY